MSTDTALEQLRWENQRLRWQLEAARELAASAAQARWAADRAEDPDA